MKRSRTLNYLMVGAAIVFGCLAIGAWVRQDSQTNEKASSTSASVEDLSKAVNNINNNSTNNTVVLCTILLSQDITIPPEDKSQVEAICKKKVEDGQSKQTSEGTELSGQTDVSGQSSGNRSSSSTNNTPTANSTQPDNSQSPTPPDQQNPPIATTPPPDNDGVMIDLPLLPVIHIPSPL